MYENINTVGEYPIYDKKVVNLLFENFAATLEYLCKNHLIDGEDDIVICID